MKTLLLASILLAALVAFAAAQGGPCPGGFWPDQGGCCPLVIGNTPFYRDASGCYPRTIYNNLFYPDGNKCYPNASGVYQPAGQPCPATQQCDTSSCILFSSVPPLGACANGQPRDASGCCSKVVGTASFYRDAQACYPILTSVGPRYADANGCYPDANGNYATGGSCTATMPHCVPACDLF